MKKLILSMAVVKGLAACAGAAFLPIANPSFETQVLADGVFIANNTTGWTDESAANTDWVYNPGTETPDGKGSDGENVIMLWHSLGITQTLAGEATDNTHYKFEVDIFVGASYTGNEVYIGVGGTLVQSNDQSWDTGDSMVAINQVGAGGLSNLQNTSVNGTGRTNFTSGDTGGWHTLTLEWDQLTGSGLNGEDITIYLRKHPTGAGGWTMMDNASLEATAIPEPATIMLIGSFGVGCLALRRFRI